MGKGKEEVPLVLIGSKCDLESSRVVESSEGEELAHKWGCPFFETSAKTEANVQEVFTELVRIVKASKQGTAPSPAPGESSGCCVLQQQKKNICSMSFYLASYYGNI